MDMMTVIGLLVGVGSSAYVIWHAGNPAAFWDPDSFILVLGGTVGCTLMNYQWGHFRRVWTASRLLVFPPKVPGPQEVVELIMRVQATASSQGIDAVRADDLKEPFLRAGVRMIVEDRDEGMIHDELRTQAVATIQRHQQVHDLLRSMAMYAPVFGLLGTLVGIVEVLRHITDPAKMAQYMGLAIITTFYGIAIANFLFLPAAGKLEGHSNAEMQRKELMIVGLLSIKKGELPSVMRQRLERFLMEARRK